MKNTPIDISPLFNIDELLNQFKFDVHNIGRFIMEHNEVKVLLCEDENYPTDYDYDCVVKITFDTIIIDDNRPIKIIPITAHLLLTGATKESVWGRNDRGEGTGYDDDLICYFATMFYRIVEDHYGVVLDGFGEDWVDNIPMTTVAVA